MSISAPLGDCDRKRSWFLTQPQEETSEMGILCVRKGVRDLSKVRKEVRATHPFSAIEIAGSSTSAIVTLPLPKCSSVSTHAAAQPGTVTELMLRKGISLPSTPSSRTFSSVKAAGARPDPLSALTSPVLAL